MNRRQIIIQAVHMHLIRVYQNLVHPYQVHVYLPDQKAAVSGRFFYLWSQHL